MILKRSSGLEIGLRIGRRKPRLDPKYRQKPTKSTPSAPAKQVRAIQIQANDSGSVSESDGSGGSDSDVDSHRKIFLAANEDVTPKMEKEPTAPDPRLPERDQGHQEHNLKIHGNGFNRDRCSHCGSRKHSDLGCWRRGKRGHHSDHCLFVCRGCGELHDMGKCPMEEFYNQIRQLVKEQIYTVIHMICMGNAPSQFQVFSKSTNMPDPKSP
ncbi:hypothetical protein PHMEG_00021793 [Phytophthora megakarya]|uniref:Eukaryotic/viral aspartic protease n=1 Tax=Phytophthora megakarya TaxID=4795 RepID=A0A225VMM3_9STRA|nr:hypothetical protein PHMEG_00021793 [Phytophthora megakarya]